MDPPDHPHSSYIMMSNVAVDQKVADALLATPATALVLHIVALRWSNGLGVGPGAHPRKQRRMLVQAGVEISGLNTRLPTPSSSPAVDMVHVEHLGASVHYALLDRITQIGSGHGRRGIAECVGTVGLGHIESSYGVMLQLHPVHKWLAAVIHGPSRRLVGTGEVVHEGD